MTTMPSFDGSCWKIDGHTHILGVIGDPISHTLSPAMHNLSLAAWELNYRYLPFRVKREGLEKAVHGLVALGVAGFNATIPHKEALVPLMDWVSPEVGLIGAINTVAIAPDGQLRGYNTDAYGFITALREEAFHRDLATTPITILGAGGAARAILAALLQEGARNLVLANRSPERAERLAADLSAHFDKADIQVVPWTAEQLPLEQTILLINTTCLGLKGERIEEVAVERLPERAFVFDLVYSAKETPLVEEARKRRLQVADGISMLTHQGARAFEIWTGRKMPVEMVKNRLRQQLGEK